jgi:hypothetical protein
MVRKFRRGQSGFAACAVLLLLGGLEAQEAIEQQPASPHPLIASEPLLEQGVSTECQGGYTTTTCSLENEKFAAVFSIGALLAAVTGALLLPIFVAIFRTENVAWWRASPFARAAWCGGISWVAALAFLVVLPYLTYREYLPPRLGLLAWPGLREDFFASCQSCSAAVSNYPLYWGWLGSFGMPAMGLAIEHPLSLLVALTSVFLMAIGLLIILHFAWRRRMGFARLCREGEAV